MPLGYRRSADQGAEPPVRHPVVVVGAGPVGLTLAIDLAQRGVPVVLLDDADTLATGSRAICFAKRSLEVFDRLGCGQAMVDRGVSWNVGRVFLGADELYRFDLQAEPGHARPAFINLQQYHVERFLVDRAAELADRLDLRWKNQVVALEQQADHALLTIETPDGPYRLRAGHVAACDGSRSPLRRLAGEESRGRTFRDRFLIADVRMPLDFPAERWFWFDPPFHPGQSVLLHKQPDGLWRIDFQLGWDADPEREKRPEHILPRVRALLAGSPMADAAFELEWASVYTFACTRMSRFRVGRTIFAGDAAHGVSPFGARGANSGIQDADNLGWKLAAVIDGRAGEALLESYAREREAAADENILNSTRSTDFITPKGPISRLFRDAALELARAHPFARGLVNSGRLSVPTALVDSPLNTPDTDVFAGRVVPGAAAVDAPIIHADGRPGWLLPALGDGFTLLVAAADPDEARAVVERLGRGADRTERWKTLAMLPAGSTTMSVTDIAGAGTDPSPFDFAVDRDGHVAARYDLRPGTAILFRPDQHVAARWRSPTAADVHHAVTRALGHAEGLGGVDGLARAMVPGLVDHAVSATTTVDRQAHFAVSADAATLDTGPRIDHPDAFYESLIHAHRDLDADASHALNARLVLLLANQVGRLDVLRDALAAARAAGTASVGPSTGSMRTELETLHPDPV